MNIVVSSRKLGKRAAISDGFVLMIAIVIYVLVYLVFYFIFSHVALSVEDELQGKSLQLDQDFILKQYLKIPIPAIPAVSGSNESALDADAGASVLVADLITTAVSSGASIDLERLQNASKIIMQPYRDQYWRITVSRTADPSKDPYGVTRLFTIANDDVWEPYSLGKSSIVQIPHPDRVAFPELSVSLVIADLEDAS